MHRSANVDGQHLKIDSPQISQQLDRFVLHHRLPGWDVDDLRQELATKLLRSRALFDPARGAAGAFVTSVSTNHVRDLARRAGAIKRPPRGKLVSLDSILNRSASATRDETVPSYECQEQTEMELDVRNAIVALPNELQPCANAMLRNTVRQHALAHGLSRSKLRNQVARIKRHLALHLSAYADTSHFARKVRIREIEADRSGETQK